MKSIIEIREKTQFYPFIFNPTQTISILFHLFFPFPFFYLCIIFLISMQIIIVELYLLYQISLRRIINPMKLNKYQIYVVTFLCYTAIHALRTSYSYAKKSITADIQVQSKYMGIVDALMLCFLGVGHFYHAVRPIKQPVLSLWIAMILCGINYELIPLSMLSSSLANIYVLSIIMSINGFLQSYTWPNLLMIIHNNFNPDKYAVLLGFWSANANIGNILGYGIFEILHAGNVMEWQYGLTICAIYAAINGVYIGWRFEELPIAGSKQIKQKSIVLHKNFGEEQNTGKKKGQITSVSSLQQQLVNKSEKDGARSVHSEVLNKVESIVGISNKSIKKLEKISERIDQGITKSIKIVDEPDKAAETPLSVTQVFKDPNILFLTITFSLAKSVIYGIMLWLPLYFQSRPTFKQYSAYIPIAYDIAATFGSVGIGYLFRKIMNKGILMIPFMVVLFICFFFLRIESQSLMYYFFIISIVGFSLGGIFNTLSGLVVMELTKVIPENLKTSSLGFYSALTMAVGNITTAATQILIGFVIGKQNATGIFVVFMVYAGICLVCLVMIAIITRKQKGNLTNSQIIVIQQVKQQENDNETAGLAKEAKKIPS